MSFIDGGTSLLSKIESLAPASLTRLDAFPKLPSTYKARSESRGFLTILIGFLALLLMLNDIGEYIWGWPDYEFNIDNSSSNTLDVNVDMTVNMPCKYLSVDLRDVVGDRLFLTGGFKRDGTKFDVGQATLLREHAAELSARQAVQQSRKSRGFFSTLFRRNSGSKFKPTYSHDETGDACRIWGSITVKRVTANLHITTLGHGYASYEHVDHSKMNLSHVITEFSFGPHFPYIVQPLDDSFEVTDEHSIAYQYFLHVVPTTYIAPRDKPLHTHQYSVTHYTRAVNQGQPGQGSPGIFFKFELDPLCITLHQRTPSLTQVIIRCIGVLGGVFVCMGYAMRVTTRVVDVVTGADKTEGIVAAEATGAKVGLRAMWTGAELRSRPQVGRSGQNGWAVEGGGSPYLGSTSPYLVTTSVPGSPKPYLVPLPLSPAPGSAALSPLLGLAPLPSSPLTGHLSLPLPSGGAYSPSMAPASLSPPHPGYLPVTHSMGNGSGAGGIGPDSGPPSQKGGHKKDD